MFTREMKKGSTELLILSLLDARPRHGYEISKMIEARSGGVLQFHPASLYPVFYRLEKRGFIAGRWLEKPGQRRRRPNRIDGQRSRRSGRILQPSEGHREVSALEVPAQTVPDILLQMGQVRWRLEPEAQVPVVHRLHLDPEHAADFTANAEAFVVKLDDPEQHRDELIGLLQLDQVRVHPSQDVSRRASVRGLGHDQRMRSRHEDGGRHPFADDIANHDPNAFVVEFEAGC